MKIELTEEELQLVREYRIKKKQERYAPIIANKLQDIFLEANQHHVSIVSNGKEINYKNISLSDNSEIIIGDQFPNKI